ncbi:ectonucleotide pyrophosphatase/phosphodiesterase family member 1 [Oryzias melastigma]|uniref:Ectonucleotide pyrophosphatase/phosphodiesterase 1 n=1 Tax=Oryzias melastigma TaxID=30732 RepID=A0A3B3E0K4_ORYME|nr:ectonucleotide pyrophosphatase/phosphodiesterase family member 1 [Oryzias melastigma]
MEATKAEEGSSDHEATVFGTSEPEGQKGTPERRKNRIKHPKIIAGVLLLILLIAILAALISMKSKTHRRGGELWLEQEPQELHQPKCPSGFSRPPLILVSLDGFRAQYLKDHQNHLPIISALRNRGTTAPYIRPVYPTKTFPNHYTIVTGLYPESHGIVDNKMYDVTRNAFFSLRTDEKNNPKWYQGEPIWITAKRQTLKAATFFWPGSDVKINGTFPNIYEKYNRDITFETRVSTLLNWLSLPEEKRPDFYTLYLEEPDRSGHGYGPESSQVIDALKTVDDMIGELMDGLTERNLHHCVNLIIMSDHGMEKASCEKAAFVSNYLPHTSDFDVIQGPAARIRPKRLPEDYFSFDYEGLVRNLSCSAADLTMRPYLKEHLPKRMHFANNIRIERGHLYMKPGWQAALSQKEVKYCEGGFHGSDNIFTNMQAIFIGYGPGFLQNTVVPPFENIEVYNLMCDLLNIRPAPNNGTHGSLNHLLRNPVHRPVHPAQLSHDTPCEASVPAYPSQSLCNCSSLTVRTETLMNEVLLANTTNKDQIRRLHHPYGTPGVVHSGANFCLLYHSDYINGYSKDRLMPLWVSYTMRPLMRIPEPRLEADGCIRADIRVPQASSQKCLQLKGHHSLTYGLMHPHYLNSSGPETDSLMDSNMVPMFPAFKKVWNYIHQTLLTKYSQHLNGINILSGPIFDTDYNGNVDPIGNVSGKEPSNPTHFFLILTSCQNETFSPNNCVGPLKVQSFVLPHRPDYSEVCKESDLEFVESWMSFHAARVRDIELLTGLSFYHSRISVEETLRLKTFLDTQRAVEYSRN